MPLLFIAFLGADHQALKRYTEKVEASASTLATEVTPPVNEGSVQEASVASPTPREALEFTTQEEAYVYEVFGEYYDKAILLLTGNGECGGENKLLDPYAVNSNSDGSRDRGIFQINDKFHPLTDEQAFDYRQNIDYAWRMFVNDNYTFIRWTAGRCLNI